MSVQEMEVLVWVYKCMGMSSLIQLSWGPSPETAPHNTLVEGDSSSETAPGDTHTHTHTRTRTHTHTQIETAFLHVPLWMLREILVHIHTYTHTLCNGMRTRCRNCLCSSFKGRAKPLIIL